MVSKKNRELFSALLYIVVGVLLVIFRSQTLGWAMTIAGAVFVISGILDLVKKNWMSGAISLIIGVAIILLGWLVFEIVLLVLGILIALKGVVALINELKGKKVSALGLLFPLLTILVGVVLAFGNGVDIVILIAGILLAVNGVLGLLESFKK